MHTARIHCRHSGAPWFCLLQVWCIFTEITAVVLVHLDWVHQIFWCILTQFTAGVLVHPDCIHYTSGGPWVGSMQCSTANDWIHYNCSGTFWLQSLRIVWCIATGLTAEVPVHCNWVHCRCSEACCLSSPWPVNNYSKPLSIISEGPMGDTKTKDAREYLMCKKKKNTIKNENR